MSANVFQGAEHIGGNWGRRGQMIAHRMVSLLVGCVGQRDWLALGRNIAESAPDTIGITRLLELDTVAGLIGELVVSLGIGSIVLEATDLGILVDVVGAGAADESQAEQLELEVDMSSNQRMSGHCAKLTYLYILLVVSSSVDDEMMLWFGCLQCNCLIRSAQVRLLYGW